MTLLPKKNISRLFIFDLIRFFSMIAIVWFHCHENFFFSNVHALENHSFFEAIMEIYSKYISFSGFTIIILSYFLIGLKGISKSKVKQLFIIAAVGTACLFVAYEGHTFHDLEWDIYSYIIASSLILYILQLNQKVLYSGACISIGFLVLPPESFDFLQWNHHTWYNPVFGNYAVEGTGSWPLIPWVGLPILFYSLGNKIRQSGFLQKKLSEIQPTELLVWTFMLLLTLPQLGSFSAVPIGPGFAKFVNRLPRIDQWSHLLWIIFFMRLSFVLKINQFLERVWLVRKISGLYLNRRFFLFYIIHMLIIGFFSKYSEQYLETPTLFDLVFLAIIPMTEVACHIVVKSLTLPHNLGERLKKTDFVRRIFGESKA